ncbi:PLP-dependent cysteine synthase family protein [Halocalculus aciditolerans]|uniref:Cysteine synthase n=1 Tax=Halocalculus aciditolerans TaxID=1383812 RepID=A0A830FFQ9_9EURY|nr:pyridoxal-phosphate dependent enzyme [Halocalculus aciditolerans]GGL70264.1 cysteine synthase [Halocalculus aciditolerans]
MNESTVGRTPLLELDVDVPPRVLGKAEWFNALGEPFGGGSVKTRIAKSMLDAAEANGTVDGKTVLAASSGNTGTALARIGASRGYDVEVVMPATASATKAAAVRDAGARVREAADYEAMLARAEELLEEHPDEYVRPDQYSNPANPGVHAGTTGVELWRQTNGEVTHFVAGAGTGGTVTGVAAALGPRGVDSWGYQPEEPAHGIDGLKYTRGARFHEPAVLDESRLDGLFPVETADAYREARALRDAHAGEEVGIAHAGQWAAETVRDHLRVDGRFLVGPSSGGALAAVHRLTERGVLHETDTVVVPLPDRGDRYREEPLWAEHFDG